MICALGYGNSTKVARSNHQKHTIATSSVGTFLPIAACHLSRVSVVQGTYRSHVKIKNGTGVILTFSEGLFLIREIHRASLSPIVRQKRLSTTEASGN